MVTEASTALYDGLPTVRQKYVTRGTDCVTQNRTRSAVVAAVLASSQAGAGGERAAVLITGPQESPSLRSNNRGTFLRARRCDRCGADEWQLLSGKDLTEVDGNFQPLQSQAKEDSL